jgi:hypothetical protein
VKARGQAGRQVATLEQDYFRNTILDFGTLRRGPTVPAAIPPHPADLVDIANPHERQQTTAQNDSTAPAIYTRRVALVAVTKPASAVCQSHAAASARRGPRSGARSAELSAEMLLSCADAALIAGYDVVRAQRVGMHMCCLPSLENRCQALQKVSLNPSDSLRSSRAS